MAFDVQFTTPFSCEYWSMLAYVVATTTSDSTVSSTHCFAVAVFLFSAFPPKNNKDKLHWQMTYRGKRFTLKVKPSSSRQRRGDEALNFLRSIPEVLQEKWTKVQFDKLWKELSLYVQHGHPGKASIPNLRRTYKHIFACAQSLPHISSFGT